MPAPRTNNPTRTNKPTRSSDQVNCLRCAMICSPLLSCSSAFPRSHQEPPQIGILRLRNLLRRAFEINPAFTKDEKLCQRAVRPRRTRVGAVHVQHATRLRIKEKIRQPKSVLQPVRGEQGRYSVSV